MLLQGPHDAKDVRKALSTLAEMYRVDSTSSTAAATSTTEIAHGKRRSGALTLGTKPASTSSADPLQLIDTARARRDLEKDIRHRVLAATDNILAVVKGVDDGLVRLSQDVAAMYTSCDTMQDKLDAAQGSSHYLVEHAEGLERQRAAALTQVQVAKLFLSRFTLSDAECAAIYSREVRVGTDLFEAMDRLLRIRDECRILLQGSEPMSSPANSSSATTSGGGTRAAMDIMSSTAEDLDQAYQKLYKWCSFEFRQPVKEGLEVSPSLREATRRLKESRQDLLRSALTTLIQTRSSILANAFMSALTMGAGPPTYLPGPIELHAHDPIRYVGDMLAWIHQTVASEREFLTSLFDEKEGEGGRRIGQRRRGLEGSIDLTASGQDSLRLGPGEALVREVLNSNLDGCCRPLKLRVEQTLRSQEGSVTSYRLAHLVQFYRITMERTIGSRATLSRTLADLSEQAVSAFAETVERQRKGIERYDAMPEPDLSLPAPLLATIATLKELTSEFSRSLTEDASAGATQVASQPASASEDVAASLANFDFVLTNLVDPLVAMVQRMAALNISKRPRSRTEAAAKWDSLLFTCNCLEALSSTLAPHAFAQWKASQLHSVLQKSLDQLLETHAANLVSKSGLAPVLSALATNDAQKPLSKLAGAKPEEVERALNRFEQCLAQDDLLTPKDLDKLASPAARQNVHGTALHRLTQSYASVVEALQDTANGYELNEGLVKRNPNEVAILLGI